MYLSIGSHFYILPTIHFKLYLWLTFVTLPLLLELDHSLEMYVLGRFHAKPGEEKQTLSFTQANALSLLIK